MKLKRTLLIVLALVLLAAIVAVLTFSGHDAKASNEGDPQATPAAVALIERKPLAQSVTLSGEFVPFQQVDVHAKVAGYIRKIYVDVGDHVKAGETLAVLEVPELSAQFEGADASVQRSRDGVRRAESDLNRAKSLHEAAHLNYTRLQQAAQARPGLIAQQELDNALAKDKESEAQISADEAALAEARGALDVATANQKQYKALSDYTRIVAPFSGVITKRWVDTGALVQAGTNSNTQALPVISVAETDLFRLTLPVPESAVPSVRLGSVVKVHVQALNRDFEGKVSRFADDLSQETRTMHTEVDVHNPDDALVSGMYAEVKLRLKQNDDALSVPIEAVTRNGSEASVLLVDRDNRISDRKITIGLESADRLQVLSGLDEGDRVVVGNRSQFRTGELVDPKPIALRKTAQEF
jgi:RND family efflux transporter MFP subunit